MTNKEISGIFKLLGKIMEIHDENAFKTRSYSNAAFQIDRLSVPLSAMKTEEIAGLQGIGKAIQAKIAEILESGQLALLNSYLQKTPTGVLDMMKIKGIGGKKIGRIWRELGVESLGELLYACHENRLALLKGFGKKTQENIIKAIEFIQFNKSKFLFAEIEPLAKAILQDCRNVLPQTRIALTGDIRRKCIVIDKIEFVVGTLKNDDINKLASIEQLSFDANDKKLTGFFQETIPVTIYLCNETDFVYTLWKTTGSDGHLKMLGNVSQKIYEEEPEIYESSGFAFVEPEMREESIPLIKTGRHDTVRLLEPSDIRGVIHTHTTYSDGANTMEEMVEACIQKGYEYLAISDHSRSAFYASGLSVDELYRQWEEIDRLNERYPSFRIFKSIESDILNDGSLDYPDDILARFDFVIASIHSNLKMNNEKATQRLLTAVRNPYTKILGHPTGRLLLSRPGYPVNHREIIDACAKHGVAIEVNANPYRLDLDWQWIPYAIEKGVMISINPDAHSIQGIDDIYYGICASRKAGLTPESTLNTLPAAQFIRQLSNFADVD